uniref:SF3 helicase domain-containing protein n=1 Tax=viral metagenome TaxID=1070528 RepID=A0A6C0CSB5_9ZZZZ
MEYVPNWCPKYLDIRKEGAQIIYAKDVNNIGTKNYASAISHEQFVQYAESCNRQERNFYEYIIEDKPVKIYFDYDLKERIDGTALKAVQSSIIEHTIASLQKLYNVDNVTEDDFCIIDSSGIITKDGIESEKTSFHIVLCRKVCFENIQTLKLFYNYNFTGDKKNKEHQIINGLDKGVYRTGCFRMPGSTKRQQNRHLRILKPDEFSILDCLVTYVDTSEFRVLGKFKDHAEKKGIMDKIMEIQNTQQQISERELFVQCIHAMPEYYVNDYTNWINFGIKLFRAGADESIWLEFSKRSSKFNESESRTKWRSFMHKGEGSIASVFYEVQKFDAEIVHKLKQQSLQYLGKYCHEIAFGLARLYGNTHVYSKGMWYYFNSQRWLEDTEMTYISRTIMTKFQCNLDYELKKIHRYLTDYSGQKNAPDYLSHRTRLENLLSIKDKTQSGRIGNDWHVLKVAFDQPFFAEQLDTDRALIGFNNGVFDLHKNDTGRQPGSFRQAEPEDYMTMSVKYDYIEPVKIPKEDTKDFMNFCQQVFPDSDVFNYVFRFMSSCLAGFVNEEMIHFFTGLTNKQTGSNAKSTFVSLIIDVLGDYACAGHSSIITSKRESAQNANSAIMSLKAKRFVAFQEIDNENCINMPVIKGLTGNDFISGRQLYKSQETFLPHWKMVVCANKLPPVSSDDGGTRRRLMNVPFESKFVDDVHNPKWANMDNVYPIDYHLKTKLKRFRMPCMLKLMQEYVMYRREGLLYCARIQLHTLEYFKENDPLFKYIEKYIRPHENPESELPFKHILDRHANKFKDEDLLERFSEYFPTFKYKKNDRDRYVLLGMKIDEM